MNTFYKPFDYECQQERESDYRTPFQQDRDRIIYSFAFRRLQAKTQVFLSGEYDFYRTRLTHSIEVAQIGRSICNYLRKKKPVFSENFYVDPDLVEAACLSHDLGHPPFGHAGESLLNHLMKRFSGFEGNAQSLRIITEAISSRGGKNRGMVPTRAFVDSILKYKTLYSQMENPENHFLYNDQKKYLDFVFNKRPFPAELTPGKSLNKFRSIECEIMDWADDTSYSLNDMVDSIKAGFLTRFKIEKWAADQKLNANESRFVDGLFDILRSGNFDAAFSQKIGHFIQACGIEKRQNFMSDLTNRYRYKLVIDPMILQECELYKRLSLDVVFNSPQLKQLVFKGHFMLRRIFDVLVNNYIQTPQIKLLLLPKDLEDALDAEDIQDEKKARIICDYIAGMTDRFAIRIYKRLFDPDFGSIVDLI
ncbi:MAG: dNTP triphosphohydrolase [Calditrichaeota bacterium]|nr:dNTP triphosphohydrolase [Calditrichota bacterium]